MMKSNIDSQSWQTLMHSLHNDVRNSRGLKLTGMAALNEINNYLLLFFIERNFQKYPTLDDTCKFSYMYKHFCTDEHIKSDNDHYSYDKIELNYYKVWDHWCNTKNENCVLRKIAGSARIQKYLQNEALTICAFTQNADTGKTIQSMINKIWTKFSHIANSDDPNVVMNLPLESFGFDAFGDAYEKFKLDMSSNSGKTTGQHFTPDIVKSFIVNETKPLYNELFYEPACGTGGFIHHAVKYIKKNHDTDQLVQYETDEEELINISPYEYFVKHLMANECNPEIYKPLAINMLIHDIPIERIKKRDSLDNDNLGETFEKYDIICANPPFGAGDKVNSYKDNYWGPLESGKNIIKDAMAQFIIHMYQSLKTGGRCGTVSDRGIINNGSDGKNSWQTKLRKYMVENTNLYKIVLLPKDTFEYTTFATCILFFKKGEPTKEVEFRELFFKDVTVEGIKIKEIADNKLLGKITIEQIRAKKYSLKVDDYFKVAEVKQDMSGWIKLGDVCDMYPTTKHCTNIGKPIGQYRFYSSSQSDLLFLDTYEINKESLIIGNGGSPNVHYDTMFTPSKHVTALNLKNNNLDKFMIKYLYYYFRLNVNILAGGFSGGGLKWLNRDKINNFLIPNIPLSHQTEIVDFLDEQFEMYQINRLNKQIPLFDLLLKKEWQMSAELLHLVYRQMSVELELENIKRDIKAIFGLNVVTLNCPKMKLGDIVDFNIGGTPSRKEPSYWGGTNKWLSVAELNGSIISDTKEKITDAGIKCSSVKLIKQGSILMSFKLSIGKMGIAGCDMYCNEAIMFFKHNHEITNMYLYYWLTYNDISSYASGQIGIGSLNKTSLGNISIPIPSLPIQQQIINKINQLNAQSSHYETYAQTLQQEIENIMETIKNMTNVKSSSPIIPDIKPYVIPECKCEMKIDDFNIDQLLEYQSIINNELIELNFNEQNDITIVTNETNYLNENSFDICFNDFKLNNIVTNKQVVEM